MTDSQRRLAFRALVHMAACINEFNSLLLEVAKEIKPAPKPRGKRALPGWLDELRQVRK